jgi:UDP-GlcNAc:undecaprenyl-phosphate/decaprenyl-phosphate GlcNAc-1-phosphate transferase
VAGVLLSGAVIAGSANLVNLLDLRPGRAFKMVLLTAAPLVAAPPGTAAVLSGAAAGAAAALLPVDLSEQAMLGDTGANAAGALLGLAAVQRLGTAGQLTLLGVLGALTLASEKVSFTAVIESTPGLRAVDALGRRPRA